jgi:uncharacterized protein YggT (Ycf19 family)
MDKAVAYVEALFVVYLIIIFIRILLSFVPRAPVGRWSRGIYDFFFQSTDWYLGIFRRIIPPLGMFDLSPILAIIVLVILRTLAVEILESF